MKVIFVSVRNGDDVGGFDRVKFTGFGKTYHC